MTKTRLTPKMIEALETAAEADGVTYLPSFRTSTLNALIGRGLLVFTACSGYHVTNSGRAAIGKPVTIAPVEYRLQYVRPNYGEYSHQVDAAITVLGTELVDDVHRGAKTIVWFRGKDGVEQYRPVEHFTRTHVAGEHYVAVDADGNPQAMPVGVRCGEHTGASHGEICGRWTLPGEATCGRHAVPLRAEFAPSDILSTTPDGHRGTTFVVEAIGRNTGAVILRNIETGKRLSANLARDMIRVEDLAHAEAATRLRCIREALRILDHLGVRTASQFLRARREQLIADIAQVEAEHKHVGD